jgi:spore coat protein CotH
VALTMPPEDWQSILNDSRGDEWRHATLTYDGVTVADVGVRPSGESSRLVGNAKMSMRIRFDAFGGPKFGGVDTFKLKGTFGDRSMMRERLAYFVYRAVMPATRVAHARLTVNGELRGVFLVVEIWDSDSLKAHFSEPLGALYRLRGIMGKDPYAYLGPDPAAYTPWPWEQHLAHPTVENAVPKFTQGIAGSPADLEPVTDLENLFDYLAASAITMNTDGLAGDTGVEDHFQYYDPATGKFFVLPWDPSDTWASIDEMPDRLVTARYSRTRLLTLIRDDSALRHRYFQHIRDAMAALPLEKLHAEVDRIADQIAAAAHEDPFNGVDGAHWDEYRAVLKNFMGARYANVASQIGGGP